MKNMKAVEVNNISDFNDLINRAGLKNIRITSNIDVPDMYDDKWTGERYSPIYFTKGKVRNIMLYEDMATESGKAAIKESAKRFNLDTDRSIHLVILIKEGIYNIETIIKNCQFHSLI